MCARARSNSVEKLWPNSSPTKLREGIIAWVRQTGMRVFLVPEMTYAVPLLRPLLFDKLPDDVKPHVTVMERYWYTVEANSIYKRTAAILSSEQHSPIMGIANGTPAVLVRQLTDTRKGQMWRDVGLSDWIFEIDQSTGEQLAACMTTNGKNLPAARAYAAIAARDSARRDGGDDREHRLIAGRRPASDPQHGPRSSGPPDVIRLPVQVVDDRQR